MPFLQNFFQSIKSLSAFLMTRTELISIEWEQEKKRLLRLLVSAVLVLLFLGFSLVILNVLVVVHYWDTPYRFHVLWGLFALYALGALFFAYRGRIAMRMPAFPSTKEVIKADVEHFSKMQAKNLKEQEENDRG